MCSPTWPGVLPHDRAAHDCSVEWLQSFDLSRGGACNIDDSDDRPDWRLAVTPKSVRINDVFSAGPKVPFHVRLSGPLDGAPEKTTDVQVCGVLTVGCGGTIERVEAVADRFTAFAVRNAA